MVTKMAQIETNFTSAQGMLKHYSGKIFYMFINGNVCIANEYVLEQEMV